MLKLKQNIMIKETKKRKFITLYKSNRIRCKQLYSNHPFFKYPFMFSIEEYCIKFTRPSLDDRKGIYLTNASPSINTWQSTIGDKEVLEFGTYYVDEEDSTEDCLIVDLN